MKEFLQKIFSEVKNNKLSKKEAMDLIYKFQTQGISKESEASELLTFEETWVEQSIDGTSPIGIKTIVCFLSEQHNQQMLIKTIEELNCQTDIVFVSQGEVYQKQSKKSYSILRSDLSTYIKAFENIKKDYGEVNGVLYLWPFEDKDCIYDCSFIVHIIQAIAAEKLKPRNIILAGQLVAPIRSTQHATRLEIGLDRCYMESWIGFERSLGIIMPNTRVTGVYHEVTGKKSFKKFTEAVLKELGASAVKTVLYQGGKRHVCSVRPTTVTQNGNVLKDGGTYLITGGCGGLGLVFAEYLANTKSANLILIGRSPLDAKRQAKIKALEELGSKVIYIQGDICEKTGMEEGLIKAREQFGNINGVIHAAGIAGDKIIMEKDSKSFNEVLEAKVKGTIALDELLKEDSLDFVCYFSSSSAIIGDFGSCDYAVGNRFLMAYANYRNFKQSIGKANGKSVVINWPLWKDGGMGFENEENTKMYLKSSGQRFLESNEGTDIFGKLLSEDHNQHLVLVGKPSRIQNFLKLNDGSIRMEKPSLKLNAESPSTNKPFSKAIVVKPSGKGRRSEMSGLSVERCLEWDIKELASKLLKIPRNKMDRDENLADFGFDSISLAEFAEVLTKHYEIEITPALFFGYPTLQKLTEYFWSEHKESIKEFYRESEDVLQLDIPKVHIVGHVVKPHKPSNPEFTKSVISSESLLEPIAIIGMSGRFPEARNIDEMWKIIEEGRNVVGEIPKDRFDWRQYEKTGKANDKWYCGCVPGISEFDPLFFEISPREAEMMDPRQRLLLQESWNALEDAGYGTAKITQSKIGMFVGVEEGDYGILTGGQGGITSNHNGILAARLSYFLNLNGPTMAINTACSSGLVAAHQACQSLRNNECDTAIAAGVCLLLSPGGFIGMGNAGMLSTTGKCYAFDKRANGMVPGEAITAVVLKKLSQAKLDGDPIYAVIKGSGLNYDGKTNGITAPSGISQTSLIKSVYDRYNVNPEDMEYIVTHGTGTKLGDPIEINALYDAFKDQTKKQNYCALTSSKTNFGHALAASGLVSLISLVQAMRHETIPASLNCEQENDYISWKESPFYVNKENKPWHDKNGKARTAAVSAFGMSGTNVHMVVQSYKDEVVTIENAPYYVLAFSAKTKEAVQQKIKRMITLLENKDFDLPKVSYTLLEGRQHFDCRCAVVVRGIEDAVYALRQAEDNEKLPNLFNGNVPRDFKGQEALQQYIQDLLLQSMNLKDAREKYREALYVLADLYCQGYEVDWSKLYEDGKPSRIHLPGYPFAKENYWIANLENEPYGGSDAGALTSFIHPLLHQNTSNLLEQKFSSNFTGQELFLADHVVKGQKVLPGVAYLEMARVAAEKAAVLDEDVCIKLKNVAWVRPIVVSDEPFNVNIGLTPLESGEIAFEIYSEIKGNKEKVIVHSQGGIELIQPEEDSKLDISSLQARCNKHILSSNQCYDTFKSLDLSYGPLYRGIVNAYVGQGEVLAKLSLNTSRLNTLDQFVLHPGLMDSALQASIGLLINPDELVSPKVTSIYKPSLPFALGEIKVLGKCTCEMWAFVRFSQGYKALDKVQKLDVDLCDEQGNICVQMRGYTSRILDGDINTENTQQLVSSKEQDPIIQSDLIEIIAKLLKVKTEDIDIDATWEEYGLEKFKMAEFVDLLNDKYVLGLTISDVSEQQNINAFTEYLMVNCPDVFRKPLEDCKQSNSSMVNKVVANENVNTNENATVTVKATLASGELLKDRAANYLKAELSSVIKLPADRIEVEAPMEKYGIDSMMSMQLINQLEKTFGLLPKTLFFEYQNIKELTGYFLESYEDKLIGILGEKVKEVEAPEVKKVSAALKEPSKSDLNIKQGRFAHRSIISKEGKSREDMDVAIIGLSGCYPEAANVEEYWKNLQNGKDCITEIPKDRWDNSLYFDEDKNKFGKTYSKWGGFIEGVDKFDPLFFNISPRDAEAMDPQERLFLQCVYKAIEDAGYTRQSLEVHQGSELDGNVGVFVGVMYEEYQLYGAQSAALGKPYALPGNPSSIANRVSYFCNFHGPSMSLDTMCSSSITSIHLACQSLQKDECRVAIAGGVNVSIHPNKYLMLAQGRFASSNGRCESFGVGGDGYVPGEGVGAVLLKPLSKAIEDGDHIYGVIKGSTLNHGGKTNGYTVPNPNAQAELIGKAFKNAGINPRAVSYIEAHGTGTSLGDPIEIAGLNKAFGEYTKDKQFCAIGSAKSNIGHCESAAGIAAVTKVLMQMKHQKIAPSLHSDTLNPYIDFEKSPFVVPQELTDWKRPVVELDGEVKEYPRIAGISAFGAGGSNAHIVIEEYISKDEVQNQIKVTAQNPAIIVLSAKDEDRIKVKVRQLLDFIREENHKNISLADVAYTLQVGREAMEERLATFAISFAELEVKLSNFLEGKKDAEGLYYGQIKHNKEALAVLSGDDDLINTVDTWISRGKYAKVIDLWVKGMDFDWNRLYTEAKPCRISLPTYPFKEESYFVPKIEPQAISAAYIIHPLLHQNTSDIVEQRFSSTFTGKEFFLFDHIVNGKKMLPGVAYLEMARAAVENGARALMREGTSIRLKNVAWIRPIIVEDLLTVHISLFCENDDEIAFEIYSDLEDGGEQVVYCQGSAVISDVSEIPDVDIKGMQNNCSQSVISSDECYKVLREMGLVYGPAHQCIRNLYIGENQVLTKLKLPDSIVGTFGQFTLHPGLMDSALQSSIGLMFGQKENTANTTDYKPSLPFALQELRILELCDTNMWAVVRYSKDYKPSDRVQKIDIDICDENGKVCVQIIGYSSRVLEGQIRTQEDVGTLLLEPIWKEKAVVNEGRTFDYAEHVVFLCGQNSISKLDIEKGIENIRCISMKSENTEIDKSFKSYALENFKEIKDILLRKHKGKVLLQVVIPANGNEGLAGLSGLMKTACMENNKIICQLIQIEPMEKSEVLIDILKQNSQSPMDNQIRYQMGKRYVMSWGEVEASKVEEAISWKDNGVYLITGGAGGLGLIFAKEIASKAKGATIILTGRSVLDSDKETKIKDLENFGAKVLYKQVDVAQREDAQSLMRGIKDDYGNLNGIIHSAGVNHDNFIIKKSEEEFVKVLDPKVSGIVNIDETSLDLELDFFIMFSSTSGSLGNFGQSDYATANAFMDSYALYRNSQMASGKREGFTLSINWPLWRNGGMHVDTETEKMIERSGMKLLDTNDGIQALYRGAASGKSQIMVIKGNKKQIRDMLFVTNTSIEEKKNDSAIVAKPILKTAEAPMIQSDNLISEKALTYFKKQVSSVIKLPVDRIEADEPMENYGMDSIVAMQLVNQMEKDFGSLPKTLFFEYQNIKELTGYFLGSHEDKLIKLLEIGEKTVEVPTVHKAIEPQEELPKSVFESKRRSRLASRHIGTENIEAKETNTLEAMDVAIIGVSGRYPMAKDVTEYWENLKNGRDCITEIPKDRWDHSLFFDENKNKPGKTYSKWGGFIEGVDQFDPLFFNISPIEAEIMDPQERLFLQCAYSAIEDAGYSRESLGLSTQGNVGTFAGVMYEEYQLYGAQETLMGRPVALTGNPSSIANRVSYFCNFHGPSMAVDTMCSSSITAIHLACQNLRLGGCKAAIAGGINVSIHPNKYMLLAQGKFASSKGRCESFGVGGDGYVPGEGVGAVLLKPLSKAIEDGDHIYGVIKASTLNHDGKTNGYTVPNPNAQGELIGRALKEAGINPRMVSYIEAHGTGTSLGDPIEIVGLNKAFGEYTSDKQFCAIGSAKSNIGHCESAAGIAAVTKVLLQLKNRQIAPSLHSQTLNPYIDFSNSPFVVQQELTDWKRPMIKIDGKMKECPRIAGISSFGAGGSNAHIVIQEYIPKDTSSEKIVNDETPYIIVLSAKDEERLKEKAAQLLAEIDRSDFKGNDLKNVAYTLQTGRDTMDERIAMLVKSFANLKEKLNDFMQGKDNIEDFYYGQAKQNKKVLSVWTGDEDLQNAIEMWLAKRKYSKLIDMWVKGLNFDWNKLYTGENKPCRISLPTYPFAKERYWLPRTIKGSEIQKKDVNSSLGNTAGRSASLDCPPSSTTSFDGKNMLIPVWDIVNLDDNKVSPALSESIVVAGQNKEYIKAIINHYPNAHVLEIEDNDTIDVLIKKIEKIGMIDHVIWAAPRDQLLSTTDDSLVDNQDKGVLQVFRLIKAILALDFGKRDLGWTVITTNAQPINETDVVDPTHASIHGLMGAVAKEYTNWKIRLLDLDSNSDMPIEDLLNLPADRRGHAWVYRNKKWYRRQLVECKNSPSNQETYKTGGVYVVLGGAGGVGEIWSDYMIRNFKAQIIWIGRRQKNEAIQSKIDRLALLGPVPHYISANAADKADLQRAYEEIKKMHPKINGVVQSAMVFFEQRVEDMEEEGLRAALSAKIDVSVHMAQVFKKEQLDFVLFFSSIVSMIKNPGQSGYASGCTFKDSFAHSLSREWSCPVKVLNWGYWANAIMGDTEAYKTLVKSYLEIGIGLIEPEEGMKALDVLMSGPMKQMAFMKTSKPLPIEGVNQRELIKIYPQKSDSKMRKIQEKLMKRGNQNENVRSIN